MSGKVKYNQLSEYQRKKYLGEFYSMVAMLRTREEVKRFFKDLLSLSEVVMISRRIQIAQMLLEGKGYEEIRQELKVGFSNISQVERWLRNGFGGYKEIITRYHREKQKNIKDVEKKPITPYSLDHIRKKYPLHFLLLNLLKDKK